MKDIVLFLSEIEIWFYIGLGLLSFYLLVRLFSAIGQWRDAAFGLEREIAQRKFGTSLTFLILIFLLALSEFFLVTFSASTMPDLASLATPTMDLLATPTHTVEAPTLETQVSPAVTMTATVSQEGCVAGQLEWLYPRPGDEVQDVVTLSGTIDIPDFGFFKYEYTEPGNSIWKTIGGGNLPILAGEFGAWNTTQLIPGDYLLRLVVLDNKNAEYPACVVPVRVLVPPSE